jgi:hypothetical protein
MDKRPLSEQELDEILNDAEARSDFVIPTVMELDEAMRELYKLDPIGAWAFRRKLRWAIKKCNKQLNRRWKIK